MTSLLIILLVFLTTCVQAQKTRVQWHHNLSPYRVVFTLKQPGNVPRVGAVLSVPVCGLGGRQGNNVFCYDENGKQLLSRSLGIGTQNCALIQVLPDKGSRQVLAYFGSEHRAPSAKFDVAPPLCQVYTLPKGPAKNWQEVATRLASAELIGQLPVRSLEQVVNPIDSRDEFIMVMTASLNSRREGVRNLFVASDDAGYLHVDDTLLVSRDGVHKVYDSLRGENHKAVKLSSGMHSIRLTGVNFGENFALAIGEWFPSGVVKLVPPNDFVQGQMAELNSVETHRKEAFCPCFKYIHTADLPLEDKHLTMTILETYGGDEANWLFSDGVQMTGSKVTRLFIGLDEVQVKVQCGKGAAATGNILFPQTAPSKTLSTDNPADFSLVDGLLPEEHLKRIRKLGQLEILLELFLRRDLHPKQVLVAEAILRHEKITPELRQKARLALARSAAMDQPDKSLKAYDALLKNDALTREETADLLWEAVDFAIFRMRDYPVAEGFISRYGRKLPKNGKALLAVRFDLALQSGRLDEARRFYQELLEGRTKAEERRSAAVHGGSIQANVTMLLNQGKILEAEAGMREWIKSSPQDRANGSFSLVRARCFHKRGWFDGAIGELTGAIQADPLLPNLPDVEFELALNYQAKGERQRAQELFRKIASDYPNHPLAKEAERRVK